MNKLSNTDYEGLEGPEIRDLIRRDQTRTRVGIRELVPFIGKGLEITKTYNRSRELHGIKGHYVI